MESCVNYSRQDDIICVSANGYLTSEKIIAADLQILKLAAENNCRRALCDFTETRFIESIIGIYEIPFRKRSIGFPTTIKVAAIYATDEREHSFFETVSQNRGFVFRVFKDRAEAIEWLQRPQE